MYQGLGWLFVIILWMLLIVIVGACIIGQFAHIIISTISIIKPPNKSIKCIQFNIVYYICTVCISRNWNNVTFFKFY